MLLFLVSQHCYVSAAGTLDGIIDTVSGKHVVNALLALLAPWGRMILVGVPLSMPTINHFAVVQKNLVFSGSAVGTLGRTQEMMDFCGEKNITADVEVGVGDSVKVLSELQKEKSGAAESVRHSAATVDASDDTAVDLPKLSLQLMIPAVLLPETAALCLLLLLPPSRPPSLLLIVLL
jgi:hypothetical protein